MKKRPSGTLILVVALFVLACVLGVTSQRGAQQTAQIPRAQYADASPLGGKGLRLLLERLNYRTRRETGVLTAPPRDVKVWILLDAQTGFSRREAKDLLLWVQEGGTLIWAATPASQFQAMFSNSNNSGLNQLKNALRVADVATGIYASYDDPLPPLSPLTPIASEYGVGVKTISASPGGKISINRAHLEIAKNQLAQIPYGLGRVFVAPDALLFTNYALSKPDNAVLVSNLIRLHASENAMIVFDERQHGENIAADIKPNWLYYLWRPPLRYAVIQLFLAAILAAILYGRRLGAPVPLPDGGPVTRASQFAAAMGALFQKVDRPRAAGTIIGEDFRRRLTRRLGLSPGDDDELIAQKTAEATGLSARTIDRLLLQAKSPDDDESRALSDAQAMEMILRKLEQREF